MLPITALSRLLQPLAAVVGPERLLWLAFAIPLLLWSALVGYSLAARTAPRQRRHVLAAGLLATVLPNSFGGFGIPLIGAGIGCLLWERHGRRRAREGAGGME
jgi:hypothetical protein